VDAGLAVADAPFGAGLRIGSGHPRTLPGYEEGAFLVQDPAQALVVRFAAIPAGAALYDACAAPGGKAVALAARGARVTAGDVRRERLERLFHSVRRTGVAVHGVAADILAAPFRADSWDAVLVDARAPPPARWPITRTPAGD
jgi:16S rRNA (cytosine967-C5)-methyltransferase